MNIVEMQMATKLPPEATADGGAGARWQAFLARDKAFDGKFVVAVTSTKIYCRPSCPSRRPRPENVRFYALPEAAQQAGFRACKRCRPETAAPPDPQVAAIRRACQYLDRAEDKPTLGALARHVGLSAHHLQRLFTKLVGLSPRAYADARRIQRLKTGLRDGDGVTRAMYGAGFGSSSRLYEAAAAELGMTPARWKSGGAGERIGFAVRPSPLGLLLVAATERGIAFLGLGEHEQRLERELREELPKAVLVRDDGGLGGFVEPVLKHLAGKLPHVDLPLDVRATAFQRRVWQELRKIPLGTTTTYKRIAEALGRPTAARAVARAVATNPVSVLIPCHRVIRGDGNLGGYRWGLERKERLLDREKREAAT